MSSPREVLICGYDRRWAPKMWMCGTQLDDCTIASRLLKRGKPEADGTRPVSVGSRDCLCHPGHEGLVMRGYEGSVRVGRTLEGLPASSPWLERSCPGSPGPGAARRFGALVATIRATGLTRLQSQQFFNEGPGKDSKRKGKKEPLLNFQIDPGPLRIRWGVMVTSRWGTPPCRNRLECVRRDYHAVVVISCNECII